MTTKESNQINPQKLGNSVEQIAGSLQQVEKIKKVAIWVWA